MSAGKLGRRKTRLVADRGVLISRPYILPGILNWLAKAAFASSARGPWLPTRFVYLLLLIIKSNI